MAPSAKDLMRADAWSAMIMGNHALARAMIESRTQVITTYPGSPTPEIAAALVSVPEDSRPYYFEYSTNEKVALEVAAGASLNGHLACCFFKSVGLNVAADSLIQLPLMELIGGMVVILGDDPGANSSQNEQDNRHFARMSAMPMFEPATPSDAYETYLAAAKVSREKRMPVFIRMTTHVCHAREVVSFRPLPDQGPDWTARFDKNNGPYVPIAATVFPMKERALFKLASFAEYADASPLTRLWKHEQEGAKERYGVISAGLAALAVRENLAESGAPVDLLELGVTYPLPKNRVLDFLKSHEEVLIIEELDRIMETEIKAMAFDAGSSTVIKARRRTEELMGELVPWQTWALLSSAWPDIFAARPNPSKSGVVARLPQLCPGCGHRSAFHAIKAALSEADITVADIGCHSMGFLPPYEMGEVLLSMGHAVSTGSGMALGNEKRKVVTFIGDGTMIHAGFPGVINAIVNDHDIVLILLENGTTAMTGHQPRPGSGEKGAKIPWVRLFEALGCRFIRDVDAYQQATLTEHLRDAMAHKGFSLVIARHPCMLQFTRKQKKRMPGFQLPQVAVDQEKCDQLHDCVARFGCPSFVRHEDGSVTVHEDLCIGDGSCLPTCPVEALFRKKPRGRTDGDK